MTESALEHDLARMNAFLRGLPGRIQYVTTQFLEQPPRWMILILYQEQVIDPLQREDFDSSQLEDQLSAEEKRLFRKLREWRTVQAKSEGIKPYVIAHNRHLWEITKRKPKTLKELEETPGWGSRKIDRYGQQILKIILSHCHDTEKQDRPNSAGKTQSISDLRWCTKCKKAVRAQEYPWRGHTAYRCPHCLQTLGWS
jgi:ATP-dependent DNA helicase RecQ